MARRVKPCNPDFMAKLDRFVKSSMVAYAADIAIPNDSFSLVSDITLKYAPYNKHQTLHIQGKDTAGRSRAVRVYLNVVEDYRIKDSVNFLGTLFYEGQMDVPVRVSIAFR